MKQIKNGLQKFTDLDKLGREELIELYKSDPDKANQYFDHVLAKLNDATNKAEPVQNEQDELWERVILTREVQVSSRVPERKASGENAITALKRDRWYVNDSKIAAHIYSYINDHGFMPANTQISQVTGLSRQTVDKHLKEREFSIIQDEELQKFKAMNSHALTALYRIGISNKDVKALKAYIDLTKDIMQPSGGCRITNNNYIQFNSITLSQENIKRLKPEHILQIEGILMEALPKASEGVAK